MKRIVISLVLLMCGFSSFGQNFDIRGFLGLNYGSVTENTSSLTIDDALGSSFGVSVTIGNRLYIQPSLMWSVNRSEIEHNGISGDTKINSMRAGAFLGLRVIHPDSEDLINVRLFTGPLYALSTNVSQPTFQDLPDADYKSNYLNWVFGAGLDVAFLFIDAGYDAGITKISTKQEFRESSVNNALFLHAGIRLKL